MSESQEQPDYEAQARLEGWRPESEWVGDNKPDEFIDAKTFVEKGENIAGMLKKKVSNLEQTVENLQSTNVEFRQYHERTIEKERAARDAEIAQLKRDREEAISEGDGQRFTQTEEKISQLQSQESPPENKLDPSAERWLARSDWYKTDEDLAAYADGVSDRIRAQGYTGDAFYSELDRRVEAFAPEKFSTQKPTSSVEGGKSSQVSSGGRTFDDLPADAKAQCDRFVRDIKGFTKETFIANYDWE